MPRPADPNAKIDLLRAAEEVFVECGVDHAKIEEITGRAGHSKGSFYLHFGSKEDAFRQIVETMLARLAACLEESEALYAENISDIGEYLEHWRAKDLEMFDFIWGNRRVMRLMLEGGGSSQFGYLIDQFAQRSREQAKRALALGIRQGLYRAELDVEIASMMLAGGYDRVAREIVKQERKPDLAGMLAAVQRFCLVGLAAPTLAGFIDSQVNNGGNKKRHAGIHHKSSERKSPENSNQERRTRNVRRSPGS
ncbi:MAG: acrR [Myxococcales bacterium]|nr:acrR [Myxococcales bacterium]